MNLAIWIAVALVSFVWPATALTGGGRRRPKNNKLAQHAQDKGLPLPADLVPAVTARIIRRQRGMSVGATIGIVTATLLYVVFFDRDDGAAPALVFFFAGVGTAFGGAWAIAAHRPSAQADRPVVARVRSIGLSDYLTNGERFGFWAVPGVLVTGTIVGVIMLLELPETRGIDSKLVGVSIAGLALVTWGVALFALRIVLAAPARSASDLELAWDDAERADGLRQVVNLTVAVAWISLLMWLAFIGQALLIDGYYQVDQEHTWIITGVALFSFGALAVVTAVGSVAAWLTGHRKGYEQRQLWSGEVSS